MNQSFKNVRIGFNALYQENYWKRGRVYKPTLSFPRVHAALRLLPSIALSSAQTMKIIRVFDVLRNMNIDSRRSFGILFQTNWKFTTLFSVSFVPDNGVHLNAPNQVCFLSIDRTEIAIGFSEGTIHQGPNGPYCHLEGWYISPELRGKGYGKKLVSCISNWCLHHAIGLLTSDTTPDYPLSPEAHKRSGFKKVHEFTIFIRDLQQNAGRNT